MSEAVAVAATPETTTQPAIASEQAIQTVAPVDPGAAAASPDIQTARAARDTMRQRISQRSATLVSPKQEAAPTESVAEPATPVEQPRGPDGKFVAQSAEPNAADPTVPATQGVPAGFVKVPVPDGHPHRDRGLEFILAPEGQEDDYRGIVAAAARRSEVDQAQQRIAELEQQSLRLRAEQEIRTKMFTGSEYAQAMAKIDAVRSVDPEAAALMERGLEREISEKSEGRFQDLIREQWGSEVRDLGNRTEQEAAQLAKQRYPIEWFSTAEGQKAWALAISQYETEIRQTLRPGEPPQFNPSRIIEIADFYALRDPWMRNHLTQRMQAEQQSKTAELQRQAEEKARQETERQILEQAAGKRRTNPLGALAMGHTTATPVVNDRPASAQEARRSMRERLRSAF